MKKIFRTMLLSLMLVTMVIGQLPATAFSIKAAETNTAPGDADFSDTTTNRSPKSIEFSAKEAGDLKQFDKAPIYDIKSNQLLLPRIEGYTVELFGSDRKETVSLQGVVTRPLTTQAIKLLYKITSKRDGSVVITEKNALLKVPGQEFSFAGENEKPNVVPALREWVGGNDTIDVSIGRIVIANENLRSVAQSFKEDYEDVTGRTIAIVIADEAALKSGDIYFTLDDRLATLRTEGYLLEIGGKDTSKNYVSVRANHRTGAIYGGISILQMLKQDIGRNNIPKGIARDYPLFDQRGMMLDAARKWFPMSYLKDLTKQMQWYKLNMLSIHLSDNDIWNSLTTVGGTVPEGFFRLESESFPDLTSKEHYTKKEFREFQEGSMKLGINVIPELDTPGHALSYTNVWPELALPNNPKYLDVTNPKTLENMKKLYDEYINGFNGGPATFVGPDVNIGTDEYKVSGSVYKEAFRAYCDALLKYVRSQGKNPVFWGSLRENSGSTQVTTDATMFAWFQGYADAKQSLDAGYKIISMEDQEVYIVPGGGYYANQFGRAEYLYNSWLPNNNSGWAGRPAPDGHPGVVGGQFAVWNDYTGNGTSVNDISYRIQHNLYSVAEKNWAGTQRKDSGMNFNEFQKGAMALGDAPNTDFLYKDRIVTKDNEVLKLDGTLTNNVAKNTGMQLVKHENVSEQAIGKNGEAIALNGGKSYIQSDSVSTGFDWTAAMWLKLDPNTPQNGILMEGKTGVLRIEDGKIKYDVEQYTHEFNRVIAKDTWTHIALSGTYEGVKLYIDGEVVDELKDKPYPNYNFNSGCNSWNGSYPQVDGKSTIRYYQTLMLPLQVIGSKTNAIKATIDEFNIYNKVLSENEVKALAGQSIPEKLVNLAAHKTISASGSEAAKFPPELAVDGDTATRWSSNTADDAWFTVDLGSKKNVNNVKIKWEDAYAKKYKILVSEDGKTYNEVFNEEDGKGGTSNITFAMQKAQYVKFQGVKRRTDNQWILAYSFFEIEVYGDETNNAPKQNVALGKKVTTTYYNDASTEGDRTGTKAVDGDNATRWEFKLNRTDPNTITIPLLADEDVNQIQIDERLWGSETSRIKSIKVEALKGDTTSVVVAEKTYAPNETPSGNPRIGVMKLQFDSVKADAIKITLTPKKAGADDLVNIGEIALYGSKVAGEITPPVEEDKTTLIPHNTMSVFASDEHPNVGAEGLATFAIDGSTSTWWHTSYNDKKDLPQSITLDLREVKTIAKYVYTPRDSGSNGIITSYELQVSLDDVNYHKVKEGTWANNATDKIIRFDAENARYVRLVAKAGVGNFASAGELNVYATTSMNKVGLQNTILRAEALNLSNYIESSKGDLANAITLAKTAITNNVNEAELVKVNTTLLNAINKLLLIGDKEALSKLYDSKKDIKESEYVSSTFIAFKKVLDEIKTMIDKGQVLSQKDIDTVTTKLLNAEKELISITELDSFVVKAMEISLIDCTTESAAELTKTLANARMVLSNKDATLYDVTKAQYALQDAIHDLKADAKALRELIALYVQDQHMYTTSSWDAFRTVLQDAKAILDNKDATIKQLYDARTQLKQQASTILVEKTTTDYSKELLKKAIDEVEDAKANGGLDSLTPSIKTSILAKLSKANTIYTDVKATNNMVIQAWLELVEVIHYINYTPDKADLKQLIASYENIDITKYENGVEEFQAALTYAISVYQQNDAAQEVITRAFARLREAKNGLSNNVIDKSLLQKMVNEIVKKVGNGSAYLHDQHWDDFQTALTRAKGVLINENAKQTDIDVAIQALAKTYKKLNAIPNEAMKKELESFINTIDAMNAKLYSAKNYAYIQSIRTKAVDLLKNFDEKTFQAFQKEMQTVYDILTNDKIKEPVKDTPTGDQTNLSILFLIVLLSGSTLYATRRKKRCK